MVIFHSYVRLPEGNHAICCILCPISLKDRQFMAVPCLVSLELHISIRQCRAMALGDRCDCDNMGLSEMSGKPLKMPWFIHGLSYFICVKTTFLGRLPLFWDPKQQLIAQSKSWIAKALETAQRTTSRSARKDWWQWGSANPSLATAVIATSLSAWSLSSWAFD